MAFDGTEGAEITIAQGAALTAEYRRLNPGKRLANFYGKDILNDILAQEGCMGIRIYYGVDDKGKNELVLVGADDHENDMLELVVDVSSPCPTRCSTANPLNS